MRLPVPIVAFALLAHACSSTSPSQAPTPSTAAAAAPTASPTASTPADTPADAAVHARTQELVARHVELATTPDGAVHAWLLAAIAAGSDAPGERPAGLAALTGITAPFRSEPGWQRLPSYSTFTRRLRSHPHVFRSYFQGTSPGNAYTLPAEPVLDVVSVSEDGDRGTKVVVRSSGADSPRPLHVKQSKKNGLYYVAAFDNLYVDIRKPVDPDAEF